MASNVTMLLFGHFNNELLSCYHKIYELLSCTYHKTYEVKAKVHVSLLLDTLNFLLITIFINVL